MTYPNAVFSAFAFIGFVMCVISFPWKIECKCTIISPFKSPSAGDGSTCVMFGTSYENYKPNLIQTVSSKVTASTSMKTLAVSQAHMRHGPPYSSSSSSTILIGLASTQPCTSSTSARSLKYADFPGHSNLTSSRYLRFLYLSGSDTLCTIPLASYNIFVASSQLSPWISWADTHADFSRVDVVPAVLWRSSGM
ncbi:hypothetical protein CVT25_004143 [Psilocybe cyanescens]|uniref:Uncharacterized protein n=1 Tax=Psilocybe cyanescens TaxID=93625 RepID=A0A409XKZ7_PSICY|nr:hypothetical protein CVT25_004143 [Psilocybe cyanescens]